MSVRSRLRVLRIRRPPNLLTAQAYEALFDRQLGSLFDVSIASLEEWCNAVLGPVAQPHDLADAAVRFAKHTAGCDFFCPSYECIPLAPLLLAIRNRARSSTRLLLIAHAAGAYVFEWALMHPLLAEGDVIIAPSESARRTIVVLCPAIEPFVRTIPHPMAPLARAPRASSTRAVVSLGRVHAEKLIHRQVEAMAILRARGLRDVRMRIGGALDDGGWTGPHPYTLALREKVRRLRLDDRVELSGPIRGDDAKSVFLSGADAVINLSITLEESFPKTPVEALGIGVPVVGTDWNGLRDTVGPCGLLVPVRATTGVVSGVDVDADDVADAIESLLASPPDQAQCVAWASQFAPEVILPRYRAALEDARERARGPAAVPEWPEATLSATPAAGLLSDAAPLNVFSWRELFELHLPWCADVRRGWAAPLADGTPHIVTHGERVRGVLLKAVNPALQLVFAKLEPRDVAPQRAGSPVLVVARDGAPSVPDRLAQSAMSPGPLPGRVACLMELISLGALTEAACALDTLAADGLTSSALSYWRAELSSARGESADALACSLAGAGMQTLGESDWPIVRQVARTARRAGSPGAALPALLAWLERFPDAQESGPVWLEACVNSLRAGDQPAVLAERYLARASALLGDVPAIQKCEHMVALARRAEALVA
ncbi:MAG: glycosyltransferase [bacterium]